MKGAIAAARALLGKHGVRCPDAIHVERLAYAAGAVVFWGPTGAAEAHLTGGADFAYVCVSAAQRGTPRGRFSIAHELGHWLLHRRVEADVIERVHAQGAATRAEYKREAEANVFAAELLMPEALFAPRCTAARPRLQHLDALSREFGTSLTATAHRYARFASSACAFVESYGGRIHRASRSPTFRGVAVRGRALPAASAAAALARDEAIEPGARAVTHAWGRDVIEHAIDVTEARAVVAWLWHAP